MRQQTNHGGGEHERTATAHPAAANEAASGPARGPAPLSPRALLGVQRTAGNAVASQLAGGRRPAVQRLIVIGDDHADVGRLVAVHNLEVRFPGHGIVYLRDADLAGMRPGEVLYISAHGSPTSVGGESPEDFAQLLLDRGLKDGTVIDLKACNSAVPSDSYVQKLERAILELSDGLVWVKIQGYTGVHTITKEGGSLAKDSKKNVGPLKQEYTSIVSKYATTLNDAKEYAEEAESNGIPLNVIAENVARMTSALFEELYAHNPKVAKRPDEATGMSRVLADLDPFWAKDDTLLKLIDLRERTLWSKKPASYFA